MSAADGAGGGGVSVERGARGAPVGVSVGMTLTSDGVRCGGDSVEGGAREGASVGRKVDEGCGEGAGAVTEGISVGATARGCAVGGAALGVSARTHAVSAQQTTQAIPVT
jgi:hypothetical protein